ncbi:exosome complex component Rrp42p [Trichomonascus vanleenenianus]|uniref:exosome non-catalytic core subunit RRP42 n=1 Tax=Trichomonascus vanleenenianus TaxID=2268995 RepID=UPI003ECB2848
MKLSPAELSYLKDSLASKPNALRPDSRHASQFRPVEGSTNFLPTANGSARVRLSDGAECIVGVKGKVVKSAAKTDLVSVDVDISGVRDDHPMPNVLATTLQSTLLHEDQLIASLKLTSRFSFKLYIDAVVLSHHSHPLTLLSFTTYLALMSTRLPLLTSSTDDATAEEIPVFHDDWDEARPICGEWKPPLLFLVAVVGDNVLIDPTEEEEAVSETGLFIGWSNGSVKSPLRSVDLAGGSGNLTPVTGIKPSILSQSISLIFENAQEVAESLDKVVTLEQSIEASVF